MNNIEMRNKKINNIMQSIILPNDILDLIQKGKSKIEKLLIVDDNGNPTGKIIAKEDAHNPLTGERHLAAHIWIYNSKEDVVVQKRAYREGDPYSGLWDISVAGHNTIKIYTLRGEVKAKVESMLQGAIRELKEELNKKVKPKEMEFVKNLKQYRRRTKNKDWINKEFNTIYLYKYDGSLEDLVLQKEEIDEVAFISLEEFKTILNNKKSIVTLKNGKQMKFVSRKVEYKVVIKKLTEIHKNKNK